MLRTGLAVLAITASGAMAQPQPQFQPRKPPQFAPLVAQVCLPLLRGGTVAQGVTNAQPLAFVLTAKNATQATVERDETFTITMSPRNCYVSLAYASTDFFPQVESELRAFLPRFGRYWAGRVESDAYQLRYRKYRAGGLTVTLEEHVDEHTRRINVTVAP